MTRLSLEHGVLILNGHRVQGLTNDGDAVEFPQVDMVNVSTSADGIKLYASTGEKGGEVTVRLKGNSPSLQFLSQQRVAQINGAIVEWSGTYSVDGVTMRMSRGVMMTGPAGMTMSSDGPTDREYTWTFEKIEEDYSGHSFPTPPVG